MSLTSIVIHDLLVNIEILSIYSWMWVNESYKSVDNSKGNNYILALKEQNHEWDQQ